MLRQLVTYRYPSGRNTIATGPSSPPLPGDTKTASPERPELPAGAPVVASYRSTEFVVVEVPTPAVLDTYTRPSSGPKTIRLGLSKPPLPLAMNKASPVRPDTPAGAPVVASYRSTESFPGAAVFAPTLVT